MKCPRVYISDFLIPQEKVVISGATAHYVSHVLRMQVNDGVTLFNGKGGQWYSKVASITKNEIIIELLEFDESNRESPLNVQIGQCLSRGERMDYAIQKATEMGVTSITPLFSKRCEVKLNMERQEKRIRHWKRLIISACEQCGRNILPTIYPIKRLEDWLIEQHGDLKLVLHHRTKKSFSNIHNPSSVNLIIGPEGGLSRKEIALAEENGFIPAALGPRVLRTETSPVAILSLLQYLWGDWHC